MYEVGDKFIIEIDKIYANTTNHGCEKVYRIKGFNSLVFDEYGLDKLEKYDCNKEFTSGKSEGMEMCEKYYQQGLNDMWEAITLISGLYHNNIEDIFGYKTLNGFDKKPLKGIPESDLKMVGCYIDHELLVDLENDNKRRKERIANGKPLRILMTVGGAGAGFDMFLAMVQHLIPYVKENKVSLFINFGDHKDVYDKLCEKVKGIETVNFFNNYPSLKKLVEQIKEGDASGIYAIYNQDIFEAVYSTNLLMPVCDLLVTKPSELAYYPIPKLFMKHIGGHEVYGAINGREYGDSLPECPTKKEINEMLDRVISDKEIIPHLCDRIDQLKKVGHYNGAYECVKLAVGKK